MHCGQVGSNLSKEKQCLWSKKWLGSRRSRIRSVWSANPARPSAMTLGTFGVESPIKAVTVIAVETMIRYRVVAHRLIQPRLERRVNAVLGIGRNQKVRSDVHASSGALLERDNGQPVKEVVQHLLTLNRRLL